MKTIKTTFLTSVIFLFAGIVLLFTGCEQDYYDPSRQQGTGSSLFGDSINIPADFDWATMRTVELNIEVDDQYNGAFFYTVELFNGHPFFDGNATMLGKGFAKKGQNFKSSLTIPTALETIFIKQIDPTGREKVTATTIVDTQNIVASIATGRSALRSSTVDNDPSVASASDNVASLRSVPANVQVNYPTPADSIVIDDQSPSSYTLQTNKSYVIRGEYTGAITFPGEGNVELFIEGVWNNTSSEITLQKDTKMIVQNGGVFNSTVDLVINGYNFMVIAVAPTGSFNENREADITLNLTDDGQIVNSGVFNAHTIKLPSAGVLYNAGDMEVEVFTINSANNITNDNSLKVTDANFTNGEITNNCHLEIGQLYTNGTRIFVSEGSILIVDTYTNAMGTTINMDSQSIFEITNSITFGSWSNTIEGVGANTALLRMEEIHFNGSPSVSIQGNIELENSNYSSSQGSNGYKLESPAHWVQKGKSTVTIDSTYCNEGGNSVSEPSTPPTNPTFPATWEGPEITYLFEDNWPMMGDYDMNDVVMNIKPVYTINASNMVTQLQLFTTLRAIGGVKRLAVGVQLDGIASNLVASVTRNNNAGKDNSVFPTNGVGLESGQTYAVIPIFDDVHSAFGIPANTMINTYLGGSTSPVSPVGVTFTITFTSPVSMSDLLVQSINPFIINGGYKNQRDEVHMTGYSPTEKANTRRFGEGDDNSNVKYYTTKGNMMFVLALPKDSFYPREYISIKQAYPELENWAISGGGANLDWYNHPQDLYIYK